MWFGLSRTLAFGMGVPLILFAVFRLYVKPEVTKKVFGDNVFFGLLAFSATICLVSIAIALIISQISQIYAITIDSNYIEGRNYWGLKRVIPIQSICSIKPFNQIGIKALVISNREGVEIYVYRHTEKYDEIAKFLSSLLEKNT